MISNTCDQSFLTLLTGLFNATDSSDKEHIDDYGTVLQFPQPSKYLPHLAQQLFPVMSNSCEQRTTPVRGLSMLKNDTAHFTITVHNIWNKDFPGSSLGHVGRASLKP
jgi:hypothetical protein